MGQPARLAHRIPDDGLCLADSRRADGQGRYGHGRHQRHGGAQETGTLLQRIRRLPLSGHHQEGTDTCRPHIFSQASRALAMVLGCPTGYRVWRWRMAGLSSAVRPPFCHTDSGLASGYSRRHPHHPHIPPEKELRHTRRAAGYQPRRTPRRGHLHHRTFGHGQEHLPALSEPIGTADSWKHHHWRTGYAGT